jgi:hypothetical protein
MKGRVVKIEGRIGRALGCLLGGLAMALSVALPLPPASAQTATAVPSELFVILASDAPGTIDPALSSLPLRSPPFDGFGTMTLLAHTTPTLTVGTPYDQTLPNGRTVRLVIDEVAPDGRYRARLSINRPGDTDYLPLLAFLAAPGVPFLAGGQRMDGGTLIIAVRIAVSPSGS